MIESAGRFRFLVFLSLEKGVKHGFDLKAMVIDFDEKYVHLRDNDDLEYLTQRKDIISFEKEPVPEETTK